MEALQPYVKNDSISSSAFADFHRVISSFESDYDFDATQESVWGRAVASEKVDSSEDALSVLRKALNERGVRGVVPWHPVALQLLFCDRLRQRAEGGQVDFGHTAHVGDA